MWFSLSLSINFLPHILHCHTMVWLNILLWIIPQGSLLFSSVASMHTPFLERCLHAGSILVCHFASCTFNFFSEFNSLAQTSHSKFVQDPSLFSLIISSRRFPLVSSIYFFSASLDFVFCLLSSLLKSEMSSSRLWTFPLSSSISDFNWNTSSFSSFTSFSAGFSSFLGCL